MSVKVRPHDWQTELSLGESVAYAFDNEVACDVVFHLGKGEVDVKAHRLILSLRSPVFFAMFNGELKSTEDTINITDAEPAAFKELLRFIYKEDAVITSANAVQMLYVAKKYMVPGLASRCSAFLEGSIHLDNVCVLLEQGLAVDEQNMVQRCLHVIMSKAGPVLTSTHWLHLTHAAVSAVLDCPSLSVGELAVFQACIAWSTAQCHAAHEAPVPATIRKHLGDLLYKVNMTNLSLAEFSEHAVPSGLLTDSEELAVFKKLTNPALKHDTPFASGRENCLLLLKPHHILELESQGECNFDSVAFVFTLNVHSPLCLIELHLYDRIGPHVVSITIKSKSSSRDVHALGYSVKEQSHLRQYNEKGQPVFVFKFGQSVNLCQTTYELSLTLLGEFDTGLYDPLQFGDKSITVTRQEKESPLFGLGYRLEDPDSKNPRPAVGKLLEASAPPPPPPPRPPPRKISVDRK